MSNNSGVTPEGLEMGRAQIVQAEAARIAPHVDMNPVLLKPTSDVGAQVVVMGRAWLDASAKAYDQRKQQLFKISCEALDRLRSTYDLIIMEGAGSCAEVNLLDRDIVNLPMAAHADAPVVLVADIHRGGVFAQIVGTLACLEQRHQERIKGFIINRFRGDIDLFKDGTRWLEDKTGRPVFGVVPWYDRFAIAAEDAVPIERPEQRPLKNPQWPSLGVIRLPHLSNFDEFDPLADIDGLNLTFLEQLRDLSTFKAVILPGSKSTRSDLHWLQVSGWQDYLKAYVRSGGYLLGVCGGYQILGQWIHDPDGIEGAAGSSRGLGLLPVETELKALKTTTRTNFSWHGDSGSGYEIHMGQTRRLGGEALFSVLSRNQSPCEDADGCINEDGHVMGTYIHGMFDTLHITRRWLRHIGLDGLTVTGNHGPAARDSAYDQLAAHVAAHVDLAGLDRLLFN
jgi:adenosylcobyric acid synthase